MTDRCGAQDALFNYYPFGQEILAAGSQDATERMRFTGHERDLVSLTSTSDDIDYMHARYDSPMFGRFLSVDPAQGDPAHPLSWNRYAYALGNPMRFADPTGMESADRSCATYRLDGLRLAQRTSPERGEQERPGRE